MNALRPPRSLRSLRALLSRRRRQEAGYMAILVAIIVPTIGIGCAAFAVDVGTWYVQMERLQKAADAAALAGVPYLPQDMASATSSAQAVAKRNGFDDAASTTTVSVGLGNKPTQLKVSITSVVSNTFATVIGTPTTTITRSATADYQGPAPMGSPCNTFGNEPNPGNGGGSATPVGTAQSSTTLAYCSRTPSLWATVEGPETGKVQGDRYSTAKCEQTGVDGCTGTSNDEFDDFGYVFVVRVATAAVGKTVDLQLYDPMFANTGSDCSSLPSSSTYKTNAQKNPTKNMNPYTTWADAFSRYSSDAPSSSSFGASSTYCTGDYFPGNGSGASSKHAMTTSFVLRQQTDTQNPEVAPVQNDTTGTACVKQYGASTSAVGSNVLTSGDGSYNDDLAASFHNWMSFCSFTPPRAGDYYLQVRTDVSLSGSPRSAAGLVRSGNTSATAATGNTTSGEGDNSFAIRAVVPAGYEQSVTVSGFNHMPIFINSNSAVANLYLIRVLPGAAGQKISFSYFDAGDAASNGSVQVVVPSDATGSITTTPFPGGCTAYGGSAGGSATAQTVLTGCNAPFVQSNGTSKNNGKTETITIPIPPDYTCSFSSGSGCWYKVKVAFGTGTVNDITTWNATVVGDPVRLVQ